MAHQLLEMTNNEQITKAFQDASVAFKKLGEAIGDETENTTEKQFTVSDLIWTIVMVYLIFSGILVAFAIMKIITQ